MRVSDAERQQVVDRLRDEAAAGRLTLDEFDERAGEAWAAKTRSELLHVLRELPDPALSIVPATRHEPPDLEVKARRRYWSSLRNEAAGWVGANAVVTGLHFGTGSDGTFWLWVLGATSIGLVTRALRGPDAERKAIEDEWRRQQRALSREARPQLPD